MGHGTVLPIDWSIALFYRKKGPSTKLLAGVMGLEGVDAAAVTLRPEPFENDDGE
jgi:hypothetical protein